MARPNSRRSSRAAFTLMEVLLVLVILVVLGSLAVGVYTNIRKDALRKSAQVQVDVISQACMLYYDGMNTWPSQLQDLRQNPSGSELWHGPYLDHDVEVDPWGNQYQYDPNGPKHNSEKPDVWSGGAPGEQPIYNH